MVFMLICTMSVAQEKIFNESKDIKAVIFDCDGTLVDSEHAHFLAWRYAFQNQGYELTEREYMTFVGKGHLIVLQRAIDMIGFDCSKELSKDKEQYFGKLQLTGIPPISSTVEFLHLLAKEKNNYGIKLAVASGARKEEILHHLKNLGIESYFDVVLSGYDDLTEYEDPEGTNKPKPYIYLKAAKMLGLSPAQCVAIEDSHPGVSSAVTAGCITIAIPNHYSQNHDLSHASLKIDSFADLSINGFFDKIANSKFLPTQEAVLK
jgi:beta-phosphoglucomutase